MTRTDLLNVFFRDCNSCIACILLTGNFNLYLLLTATL